MALLVPGGAPSRRRAVLPRPGRRRPAGFWSPTPPIWATWCWRLIRLTGAQVRLSRGGNRLPLRWMEPAAGRGPSAGRERPQHRPLATESRRRIAGAQVRADAAAGDRGHPCGRQSLRCRFLLPMCSAIFDRHIDDALRSPDSTFRGRLGPGAVCASRLLAGLWKNSGQHRENRCAFQ